MSRFLTMETLYENMEIGIKYKPVENNVNIKFIVKRADGYIVTEPKNTHFPIAVDSKALFVKTSDNDYK